MIYLQNPALCIRIKFQSNKNNPVDKSEESIVKECMYHRSKVTAPAA